MKRLVLWIFLFSTTVAYCDDDVSVEGFWISSSYSKDPKTYAKKCVGVRFTVATKAQAKELRESKFVKEFGEMNCIVFRHNCKTKCKPVVIEVLE